MSSPRHPSKSLRRAQDNAFGAHVALADAIERDEEVTRLDVAASEIFAAAKARGRFTTDEEDRLAALTTARKARVAALRLDTIATTAQAWRDAEATAHANDERLVRDVIAAAGGAR